MKKTFLLLFLSTAAYASPWKVAVVNPTITSIENVYYMNGARDKKKICGTFALKNVGEAGITCTY